MGGNKRAMQPHVQRPSPLAQVQQLRPVSQLPSTSGLVRDPLFWKRFSVAIHMTEIPGDEESGKSGASANGSVDMKSKDDWLGQQRKEKRRCRYICIMITLLVAVLIAGGAVVGWYFTKGPGK